jgi:hypothetical protein
MFTLVWKLASLRNKPTWTDENAMLASLFLNCRRIWISPACGKQASNRRPLGLLALFPLRKLRTGHKTVEVPQHSFWERRWTHWRRQHSGHLSAPEISPILRRPGLRPCARDSVQTCDFVPDRVIRASQWELSWDTRGLLLIFIRLSYREGWKQCRSRIHGIRFKCWAIPFWIVVPLAVTLSIYICGNIYFLPWTPIFSIYGDSNLDSYGRQRTHVSQ